MRVISLRTSRRTSGNAQTAGFTLLELVAALLLTTILAGAALKILTLMHQRSHELTNSRSADSTYVDRAMRQIEQDLRNARQMAVAASGSPSEAPGDRNRVAERTTVPSDHLKLTGFISTSSGQAEGRLAIVDYSVRDESGRRWLVRREQPAEALSNRAPKIRRLLCDVQSISVWFSEAADVRRSDSARGEVWAPVPRAVDVELHLLDSPARRTSRSGRRRLSPAKLVRRTLVARPVIAE